MKVLVIGGHGTLGRPVVRRLAGDGFSVRVLARSPEKARALLPPAVEVVPGDLEDTPSLALAMQGCQAVYVSVDTPPRSAFHAETAGLKNVIKAVQGRGTPRLLVLSALGSSMPGAETHEWWHVREKAEAQRIAKGSGLPWTIFEPTWFLESIPLFIHGKTFVSFGGPELKAHWIAGDDYGRMISAALSKGVGQGEVVPVQGRENLSMREAAARFIGAYDPSIRSRTFPFAVLRLAGFFSAQAMELVQVIRLSTANREPAPDPALWDKFAKPVLTPETYADYVRESKDFPQKT